MARHGVFFNSKLPTVTIKRQKECVNQFQVLPEHAHWQRVPNAKKLWQASKQQFGSEKSFMSLE